MRLRSRVVRVLGIETSSALITTRYVRIRRSRACAAVRDVAGAGGFKPIFSATLAASGTFLDMTNCAEEVNPMNTLRRRIAGLVLVASPIVLVLIETAGGKFP